MSQVINPFWKLCKIIIHNPQAQANYQFEFLIVLLKSDTGELPEVEIARHLAKENGSTAWEKYMIHSPSCPVYEVISAKDGVTRKGSRFSIDNFENLGIHDKNMLIGLATRRSLDFKEHKL